MMRSSRKVSFIAIGLALIAAGCKGCGGSGEVAPGATAEPAQSELEQLEHRIAILKIDLKKVFPKRADGVVDCGTDADCFVAMAHRCEPAVLEHSLREPGYLTIKKLHARYRIAGADGEDCTVLRLVLERDMELPDAARRALLEKGKTDAEIDAMRAKALADLAENTPDRTICPLSKARALRLALALATQQSTTRYFRKPCYEPASGGGWPSDFVAPAAPDVADAPPAEPQPAQAPQAPAAR